MHFDANKKTRSGKASAPLAAIVLAAGKGQRMGQDRPKALVNFDGQPLSFYPVTAALHAGAERVVVVVNPQSGDWVLRELRERTSKVQLDSAVQQRALGTGHAANCGVEALDAPGDTRVLILYGDAPLLRGQDLAPLVEELKGGLGLTFATFDAARPTGYGRVIRDDKGQPLRVIEEPDLSEEQRAIREVNAGIYCARLAPLRTALSRLDNDNAQGEYYLTDIIEHFQDLGGARAVPSDQAAVSGANAPSDLKYLERLKEVRDSTPPPPDPTAS